MNTKINMKELQKAIVARCITLGYKRLDQNRFFNARCYFDIAKETLANPCFKDPAKVA